MADDPRIVAALEQTRRLFGAVFEEIDGARVSGEVPVSEGLLNRLIADKLRAADGPIASAELQVRAHEELAIRLRLRKPSFAPAVIVMLQIERQPAPPAMDLVARWSLPGLGLLAAVAAPVVSFFKKPPPGMRIDGDRIVVDLAAIARDQGVGPLLPFVTGLSLSTRDRVLVVAFSLAVPGRAAATPEMSSDRGVR